jgi:ubiquinone/menaquinone biosynthesis C-methylase UbiE
LNPGIPLSFVGLDGNNDSLRVCELKKVHYAALDCGFVRCDLSKPPLPLGDGAFDLVYCSEVLQHLREPEKLLGEVRRILKPQGYFLIVTLNEPNLFQRSYWSPRRRQQSREDLRQNPFQMATRNDNPMLFLRHVSLKAIGEWERCLAVAGFEPIDFERGALIYDVPSWLRGELSTGLRFLP